MKLSKPMEKALKELYDKKSQYESDDCWIPTYHVKARERTLYALKERKLAEYKYSLLITYYRLTPMGTTEAQRLIKE